MLQTFSLDGTGRQVDAAASFFRYEAGAAGGASEALRVTADGNDLGTYLPGDAVRLPLVAKRWTFTPASAALVGTIRLGVAAVESARLVGTVNVVDDSATKTLAGRQHFIGVTFLANATLQGVLSLRLGTALQAAGARAAVKRVIITSPTAGDVILGYGTGTGTATVFSNFARNKLLASTASGVEGMTGGAAPGTAITVGELPGFVGLTRLSLSAGVPFVLEVDEPFVIQGTNLLAVIGLVVNRQLTLSAELEEL